MGFILVVPTVVLHQEVYGLKPAGCLESFELSLQVIPPDTLFFFPHSQKTCRLGYSKLPIGVNIRVNGSSSLCATTAINL